MITAVRFRNDHAKFSYKLIGLGSEKRRYCGFCVFFFVWWVGWETERITAINGFAFACRMRSGAALSVDFLDSLIWGALRKSLLKAVQQRWGINNVI